MRMKTLLLGSAAVFAFAAGSAQAADLSVAEPVDYVRVCDAFGSGYYYIPGTDTCLRIGGFVRFEIQGSNDEFDVNKYTDEDTHNENYTTYTKADFQIEARSQTDWGPLIAYMEYETEIFAGQKENTPLLTEAFLSIGPLTAGLTGSPFDVGGGYTMSALDWDLDKANQVILSWAVNGFGIMLAAQDQQSLNPGSNAGDIPDLVAAITAEAGNIAGKFSFLYSDPVGGSEYGVNGSVEVTDLMGGSDKFTLQGGYWNHNSGLDTWQVLASFKHYWQSNLTSAITAIYYDKDVSTDWKVAFDTMYSPVEDFYIGGQVIYTDSTDNIAYKIRLQRNFNN